jgi:hypothetical protein
MFAGEATGSFYKVGFGGFGSTDADDLAAGNAAMAQFQSIMSGMYPGFSMTPAQMTAYYQTTNGGQLFPMGLGTVINNGGPSGVIPASQVTQALQNLAASGGGNIPQNWSDFGNAISNVVTNPGFIQTIVGISPAVAAQVVSGLSQVGTSVLNVGTGTLQAVNLASNFIWLLPIALLYVVWQNREQLGNAATGGLLGIGEAAVSSVKEAFGGSSNPRPSAKELRKRGWKKRKGRWINEKGMTVIWKKPKIKRTQRRKFS